MERAAVIRKAMAEMVKLQVTERVERTGDKENGTNESVNRGMVYLRPIGRPYGSFTARRKAVWFILRTISRTYGQLKAPFGRQPKRHSRRDFLRISFMFYGFIFMYFFCVLWFY